MVTEDRPLVWLRGEVRTPPFSREGRVEAGFLLRQLQKGQGVSLPHSRAMPSIGRRCHELRIRDEGHDWRLVYRIDSDAIVIADVFEKKTRQTPRQVVERCRQRLREYDRLQGSASLKERESR
jgi:phage-related protein